LNDVISSLQSQIANKLPVIAGDLRKSAHRSGWPPHLASALSVSFENDGVKVSYPEELQSEVQSWEYGTQARRPNAVIRRFVNRLDSKLGD
jgi:hypothetical protein